MIVPPVGVTLTVNPGRAILAPLPGSPVLGSACLIAPKPSPVQAKPTADRSLQGLFASYANSLREALHEVFNKASALSTDKSPPSFQDVHADWLRKAEDFITASSADVLGLPSGALATSVPSPSLSSFLEASGHLSAPATLKGTPIQAISTPLALSSGPGASS